MLVFKVGGYWMLIVFFIIYPLEGIELALLTLLILGIVYLTPLLLLKTEDSFLSSTCVIPEISNWGRGCKGFSKFGGNSALRSVYCLFA